ncbi:MAG: acyl-CoA synthetase [Halieaceae bacterium]|jgi:3-oxocholest-4-en-26-oate---CoA ligase|nr:acyl-CoA synthetase [Halieaceae bacterium]
MEYHMQFNLADVFELAVDTYPDREYLVAGEERRTYREMDQRANQLAHHLARQGIGVGDHVGIYAYNCVEWVETLWAVFKLRAIWVNINYRYVEQELAYVFKNADLKAVVVARQFIPRVEHVIDSLPLLQHTVMIEDGSNVDVGEIDTIDYEAALAAESEARDFPPRSGDDLYMLYTGGTTGMPKGVVWRHRDVFFALGGGVDQTTGELAKTPMDVVARGAGGAVTMFPLAPLMHGASQWAVMGRAFEGHRVVLAEKFDAQETWRLIEREKVNGLFITGDAMARPLIEVYREIGATLDVSSFFLLASSAVVFSQSVKDQFFEYFPSLVLFDSIGSSETGGTGIVMAAKGQEMKGGPTVTPGNGAIVLDSETLLPLSPGSPVVGVVARSGYIPLGYYKDEEKTAETFIQGTNGTRYAISGDSALFEADGSITMLGRGSQCINSGGEKIFPEEVDSAVKSHPAIYDVTVTGVPDERWGSAVCALIQVRDGHSTPTLESIQDHCRQVIAGYKIPRRLVVVDEVVRSPSGKPDYRWASEMACIEC